ncbi:MAG: exonuclease domain-containing protein [Rhodocyclaceae bacterium]
MIYPRLAIVDLETTGADASVERITEIGIVLVEGGTLIEEWSSLIDPDMPIPQRIQAFTGITDAMVAGQPRFEDVAEAVRGRLADAVFVAHNARFDYNFLRASFERIGQHFDSPMLCSVKFSRALDPHFARHGLDAIIERGGYQIAARHRALDDARVVWEFLRDAAGQREKDVLQRAWSRAYSTSTVPRLPTGELEALPDSPGVYVFYGADGRVLNVGRARDLRSQVLGLFTGTRHDNRSRSLAAKVRNVETYPTAGELGAQLMELAIARQFEPEKRPAAYGWRWLRTLDDAPRLQLEDLADSDPADWDGVYGCFRGEREAETVLRELVRRHALCASRLGLEQASPCQAQAFGRCKGVCVGHEEPIEHDARMTEALATLTAKAWPFKGPVLIQEHHETTARTQAHVFDRWCHLGSAGTYDDAIECLGNPRRFDADIYRLLQRWLSSPAHVGQVVPVGDALGAAT